MPEIVIRGFDPSRDLDAVRRIWREVGWIDKDEDDQIDTYVACARALVAELEGQAECLVLSTPGTVRYLREDLPLGAVTGVTTGRVARRLGLAKRVTAAVLAADALEGTLVSGLGIFDQGFYNRLGYGTGSYEHQVCFDPACLKVERRARVPRRLGSDDWEALHAARLNRRRVHGGCNLTPAAITRADTRELSKSESFGLGYFDGPAGELTHCLWMTPDSGQVESGPYNVSWMAYQTHDQLLELLALLKGLSDQVGMIRMEEPPVIQLQDLLERPFRTQQTTKGSRFENGINARAFWQMRILDLPGCLARTHLPTGEARLNLSLTDPVETLVNQESPWRGVGGSYVVTLGRESWAERGMDPALPTLAASVGAFTRLWLGVLPATSLAVTDQLSGPPELLEALDWVLRLPQPRPDWDY